MADDPTRDDVLLTGATSHDDAVPEEPRAADRSVELAQMRARVSDLRTICRDFLDHPAAAGLLPADAEAEIRANPPTMTQEEALDFNIALRRGLPIPPAHPALQPDPRYRRNPDAEAAALAAERERLRVWMFTLYDAIFPEDKLPTESELLAEMETPSEKSISEILDELEREGIE